VLSDALGVSLATGRTGTDDAMLEISIGKIPIVDDDVAAVQANDG
jgi:hypothetical protein